MSNYPDTTLTNAGHDILSEAIAKGKALIFTKVKIGDGLLEADQSVATLTAMISSKMEVPLSSGETTKGQAKLRFAVDNSTLENGFWAREVGIFAKVGEDGEETLYAYTNGGNYVDFIPDKSRPIDAQIMDVYIITANATDVKIQVDSTAFLTVSDLNDHNDNANGNSHPNQLRPPLKRSTEYAVGDIVFHDSLPSWAYLECVTSGTTSETEQNFEGGQPLTQ